MISTIFFDLGGVLLYDFPSGGIKEFEKVFDLPKEIIDAAWMKTDSGGFALGRISEEERCQRFLDELGLPENKISACIEAYYKGFKPIKETIFFVRQLKKTRPDIDFGILSDQHTGIAHYIRKKYKYILRLFSESLILISAEVGMSKKEKDLRIYQEAIKRARVLPSQILFVDNTLKNIENAKSLGMNGFYFDIKRKSLSSLISSLDENI